MRVLIVGGTGFLGGAIADAVRAAGHETAILSRGETVRQIIDKVEVITADRYGDLHALENRVFDWVFDTCAYTPDAVHKILDAVGEIQRYVMISSISAYGTFTKRGLTEGDLVPDATDKDYSVANGIPPKDRASAFAYGASYGPLKRACEIAAAEHLGDRATSLRVGLLVGAGDYTDRLTYWVRRIDQAKGDLQKVPSPGPKEQAVQLIDVRDVALFAIKCASDGLSGICNVTSKPITFSFLLDSIVKSTQSSANLVWVDKHDVIAAGIAPWSEMPLMTPAMPEFRYFLEVNTDRAFTAGLRCRPLSETLLSLLLWDRGRREHPLKCGVSPEQEKLLLV